MKKILSALVAIALTSGHLQANTSILFTDSNDLGEEIGSAIGSNQWSNEPHGFRIESTVTENSDIFTYSYRLTDNEEGNLQSKIQDFTIEIGGSGASLAEIIKDGAIISNVGSYETYLNTFDFSSQGPGSIYGLQFVVNSPNIRTLYLEFQSYLAPTMGNFFANGPASTSSAAYNAGFAGGMGDIYIPDAVAAVPEPSTYFLLGSMLLVVAYTKRKKAQRQTSTQI